ncbi:MAG: hypothetical protein WD768_06390 [Phycisphaeraceae bacterium]
MNSEHFEEAIRGLQARRPFHLFTIELVSGRSFQVDHPDALLMRGGAAVFIGPGGAPIFFDHEGVSRIIVGDLSATES